MSTVWYEGNRMSDAEGQAFSRRSHLYGDGLFETMRVHRGKICFWESHYFRLMSSMRILRMEIPSSWSPDELEAELRSCLPSGSGDYRLRLSVWRSGGMGYAPSTKAVEHAIHVSELDDLGYPHPLKPLKVDVFQEHKKSPGLLSSLKSSQSALYILAAQFAVEQGLDDVILLGQDNRILETSRGNLFVLKGTQLTTAPLSAGALRGVIREQVLRLAPGLGLEVQEESLSPFALLDADEIWMSNAIDGLSTVTHYRKSTYVATQAERMQNALRASSLF